MVLMTILVSTLTLPAQAKSMVHYSRDGFTFRIDTPERYLPRPHLDNLVAVSAAPAAERLLVPTAPDERWRMTLVMTGFLAYGPYDWGYRPIHQSARDPLSVEVRRGSSLVLAYRPGNGFGFAARIHTTGRLELAFDFAPKRRWGSRQDALTPTGVTYQPAPVPLPAPLFGLLGALMPLGLLRLRRRRD